VLDTALQSFSQISSIENALSERRTEIAAFDEFIESHAVSTQFEWATDALAQAHAALSEIWTLPHMSQIATDIAGDRLIDESMLPFQLTKGAEDET
jgi:hypothetical protein